MGELTLVGWAWFHAPEAMRMLGEHSAPLALLLVSSLVADLAAG